MTYPLKELLNAPLEEQGSRKAPSAIDRRILDAALEVFARCGYQGAKTLEIARTAGVSEKTLFQHFKNKEQLFVAAVHPSLLDVIDPLVKLSCEDNHLGRFDFEQERPDSAPFRAWETPEHDKEEAFRAAAEPPDTLMRRIRAIGLERLSFAKENPDTVKLTLQEILLRDEYREAVTGLWMEQLAPLIALSIEAGMDEGEIRRLPVATVMRVLVPVLASYAMIRSQLVPDGEWDDTREMDMMLDILFNGLRPRE
ncbi:helix-turn-helix domain-containing protein [Saccharibacillus sp. CPCC 101409]|uniref:TetR/AcrR family transcriptional regulator n=1 Tax=Saccharibacillus sp. CPCC 101409 TaxID=3058041 RepID=UPI0026738FC3|nr:TetR/AcrR family transcriptional regulator [Saccharibacillus sp. CPCC 101409]MDO3411120.1 helix-turn-helix domain-containing protein [Saccharibacillus sp. CPCC 101409]